MRKLKLQPTPIRTALPLRNRTRQYFFDDHFIGTAEVSAPGTVSDSSSVSSDSSEETDSTDIPTPEETKKISFFSTLLYILLGLNGVAFLILIIVVINNAKKRRKRRNRRRNNRNKRH
jgi:D-alanyl-D-alanine carboxypeptidase (penicillin-binding protein 5/6)